MESDTEAALLARYKKLCDLVDDYRERGFDDKATAIVDGEMKVRAGPGNLHRTISGVSA